MFSVKYVLSRRRATVDCVLDCGQFQGGRRGSLKDSLKDSLKAGGGPCVTVPTASSVKLAVTGGSWPILVTPRMCFGWYGIESNDQFPNWGSGFRECQRGGC